MGTNKVSTLWVNFTNDIASITVPQVAWETIAKEVIQITPEITVVDETTPATYRTWVYPVDLNDKGARERDIAIGYGFMSYLGDVFSIIAVNEDGSIDVSDDGLCGYCPPCGRPAMIFSSTSPIKPPIAPPIVEFRPLEVVTCVLDAEGHQTGMQEGYSKEQKFNKITNAWEDTGTRTPILRMNTAVCIPYAAPVVPTHAHMSVHESAYDFLNEAVITISLGTKTTIKTPVKATDDYGYLFISIPANRTLTVFNLFGEDVTAGFNQIPRIADNRTGFQNNLIYRDFNAYDISYSSTLFIIIG